MDIASLTHIGLTTSEAKAYNALVYLKNASVSEIARRSGVPRVNTYDVLQSLKSKGLVATIQKSNKQYFAPAHPSNLEKLQKEKQQQVNNAQNTISHLKEIYQQEPQQQEVVVYHGKIGMKTVLKQALDSTTEILNFGSSGLFPTRYKEYFNIWEAKRAQKKITMRILAPQGIIAPKKKLQHIRYLGKDSLTTTSTFIFENKVAVFFWKENPTAILITDAGYAQSNRELFEQLWIGANKKS